jgi:hypothetical protein
MKKVMLTIGLVMAMVLVSVPAQAQACCAKCGAKPLVEQVLVLQFIKSMDMGADGEVAAMMEYLDFQTELNGAKAASKAAQCALQDALASGSGVSAKLDALKDARADVDEIWESAIEGLSSGLDAEQEAQIYLFAISLDKKAAQALSGSGPCGGAAATCAAGAAPAAAAVSPEEGAMAGIQEWAKAIAAQELDAMMACYSDNFEHYEYGDKEGIQDFMEQALDMGYLEDVELDLEDAEVEMEDGEATIYPIELAGAFGSVTLEFVLA